VLQHLNVELNMFAALQKVRVVFFTFITKVFVKVELGKSPHDLECTLHRVEGLLTILIFENEH
jgi:hypothetical protein